MKNKEETPIFDMATLLKLIDIGLNFNRPYQIPPTTIINVYSDKKVEVSNDK